MFYRRIIVPLSLPAVASACTFAFLARWNDFPHLLIYVHSRASCAIALGLRLFQEMPRGGMALGALVEWNLLMTASLITMLPR
jgi:ABC-type glycerol-3-phosphate transport system permease component